MRKLSGLAVGTLLLSLLAGNAYGEYFAYGFSSFTASNNLTLNGTAYYNTDSGWFNSNGLHTAGNTNYYSGEYDCAGTNVCRDYFSFNLTGLTGTVSSATFNVDTYEISVTGLFDIYGTSLTPSQVASGNSYESTALWSDLALGPLVASATLTPGESGTKQTFTLNSQGLAWLEANEGHGVVLGGEFFGKPSSVIPEPCTATLLGTGLLALAAMARRKFRA